ncbi:anti sigma factor C-terminal domain-containing protein [Paenibacillus sp. MBLB4367]|uniref:anti sigma factor C-terminal domain-containing protein n=1 Tax=Paenibacillus sp. MBLB4367 TaxID=3384767 RepID=UPI0039082F2A
MGALKEWKRTAVRRKADGGDEEKAAFKSMLWSTRFTILTTVVVTIAGLMLAGLIGMMALAAYYTISGKSAEFDRLTATLVETHETGLRVENVSTGAASLTPWLTQRTTLKLYRQVGYWDAVAGEVHASKSLFGDLHYELRLSSPHMNAAKTFAFVAPNELHGKGSASIAPNDSVRVWEQLSHIGDGYVAEMAFSTRSGMEPGQLQQRLNGVNVRLLNMPVYAGELKEITKLSSYSSSGSDYWLPHLNLRPLKIYYQSGSSFSKWFGDEALLQQSLDQMLIDLEWLTGGASYEGKETDKQRLAYLRNNGVIVYGGVVTGPVRELEKLREDREFHHFQLGRIEVWNWQD